MNFKISRSGTFHKDHQSFSYSVSVEKEITPKNKKKELKELEAEITSLEIKELNGCVEKLIEAVNFTAPGAISPDFTQKK